ncbi:hypothetical protein SEVIR_3G396450v4 [Setaria viridis]
MNYGNRAPTGILSLSQIINSQLDLILVACLKCNRMSTEIRNPVDTIRASDHVRAYLPEALISRADGKSSYLYPAEVASGRRNDAELVAAAARSKAPSTREDAAGRGGVGLLVFRALSWRPSEQMRDICVCVMACLV